MHVSSIVPASSTSACSFSPILANSHSSPILAGSGSSLLLTGSGSHSDFPSDGFVLNAGNPAFP